MGQPGLLHQVPNQQSMILLDQNMLLGIIPEQAFQPPIGNVQTVSPVSCQKFHIHRLNTLLKIIGPENAYMAAFHFVIGIAELPANPLGKVPRYANSKQTAGF